MSFIRAAVFVSLSASLAFSSLVPAIAAEGTVPGDRWEVTSQMSMEGMPMAMPANKVKVCTPKTWTEPPGGADERMKCTTSDFKIDGDTVTWNVTCPGPPAMTGVGTITRESDAAWSGAINFSGDDGAMTIKLSGKKLEECEAHP